MNCKAIFPCLAVLVGWATVPAREWKDGDRITLQFTLGPRLVLGEHGNAGRGAATWGPFVLACDQQHNPGLPPLSTLGFGESQSLWRKPRAGRELTFDAKVVGHKGSDLATATLTTFADAGAEGEAYRVWLRAPGVPGLPNDSLLCDGEESRSRRGNVDGSIIDGDPESFVVTFDGKPAKEDWFAVTLAAPATIGCIVFVHGKNFHDGGWCAGLRR